MDQYSNYGGQQDPSSGNYSSYQYNDSYNQGGNNGGNNGSTQQPPATPTTTQGYASQRNDNYEGSGYSSGYNSYGNYPTSTASGNYQTGQSSSAGSSTTTPYNSASGGGSYSGANKTYTDRGSDYGDSSSYGGNKNPYGDSYSYKPRENGRESGYSGPPTKEGGSYDSYGSRSESGYKVQTISDTIYISNLSKDVTEEKLAETFGSLGLLKIDRKTQKPKIWIYYDKVTRLPKGDATLTYEDPDSTAAAIKYFDNQKFLDQIIKVEMSVRKVPTSGFRARGRNSRGRGFSRGIRGSGGGGPPPRDGDWACESCNANNFARRMECYKCHTPRSNAPGDGGYGSGRYSGAPRGGYRGRRGGPSYGRYADDDRGYGSGGYRNSDSSHGYDQGYRRQNKQDDRQDRRENSRYLPY
ncbi:RNA-binding protein cabeza-like isoform X2 [Rhizophagus clarus]|uniref:RNA-binding protein cabeza-like isoform X2 n=1 Tax=Rhizophagus clarus TaxID=94130 RepID=A0A8H3LK78_9GLOM|nr:RNA-binding protein cabeza-like isoform X2 [Rhizophagus clarus]